MIVFARIVLPPFFFFNDTATTEIYTVMNTLSLHDALPISSRPSRTVSTRSWTPRTWARTRSEEHTSELQSLITISYAVFCLKKKNNSSRLLAQAGTMVKRVTKHEHM